MDAARKFRAQPSGDPEPEVPMETDAGVGALEAKEERPSEERGEEDNAEGPPFCMECNHDQLRAQNETEAHEYWETSSTPETIRTMKQKVGYRCSSKGHNEANCPLRKKRIKSQISRAEFVKRKRC